MQLWRINLKPANRKGVDSRQYCFDRNIVGVGWPIEPDRSDVTVDEYYRKGESEYLDRKDPHKGWRAATNAICFRIQKDDLIWTRTLEGVYHIGRVLSEWRYDTSDAARNADIVNIRDCEWHKVGTVPGKIAISFRGHTLRTVSGEGLDWFSKLTYNRLAESDVYNTSDLKFDNLFHFLLPDEVEDIVAIYLQRTFGYLVLPSTSKINTSHYEFEMIDHKSGTPIFLQVKNGKDTLNRDHYKSEKGRFYLFTSGGEYNGAEAENVICIKPPQVEKFIKEHLSIMPPSVRDRLDYLKKINLIQ